MNVFAQFCLKIKKNPIIYGKDFLLLRDLLEDIKCLCEKNSIEESIIPITKTLERKIIDSFSEKISFYPLGNTWFYIQIM